MSRWIPYGRGPRPVTCVRALAAAPFVVAILSLGGPAEAQVNTEALIRDPLTPGFSAGLETTLALSRGNVELFDIGGGGTVQYQTLHEREKEAGEADTSKPPFVHHRGFATANARFAEQNDSAFIDQGFAHLRWTAMWIPRLGSELFAQYQFNEFLLLNARALGGAGARVEIVHVTELLLSLGAGYMFEYERIQVQAGAPDDPEQTNHRLTSYLAARISMFDDALVAQNVVYLQPRIDEPEDFRILEELELTAATGEWISLGLKVSVYHDSRPPTGVETTDLRLQNTIRLSF